MTSYTEDDERTILQSAVYTAMAKHGYAQPGSDEEGEAIEELRKATAGLTALYRAAMVNRQAVEREKI